MPPRMISPSEAAIRSVLAARSLPDVTSKRGDPRSVLNWGHGYIGKNGRRYTDYWADLFEINEVLAPRDKKTDKTLVELVCQEFIRYPDLIDRLKNGTVYKTRPDKLVRYTANYYRTYWNQGRLIKHRIPAHISFRWGYGSLQGYPVNFRSGSRVLTLDEVVTHIRRYRGWNCDLDQDFPRCPFLRKQAFAAGLISKELWDAG